MTFEANGDTFTIPDTFEGCYGQYWNRGLNMKHSYGMPQDYEPEGDNDWKYLENAEDFASFVQNIPNKGGYSPSAWAHNKKYFVLYEAEEVTNE